MTTKSLKIPDLPTTAGNPERVAELMACFSGFESASLPIIRELVAQMAGLEQRIEAITSLPLIAYNPDNPVEQRETAAGKQYTKLLTTYSGIVTQLVRLQRSVAGEAADSSPLRDWMLSLKGA